MQASAPILFLILALTAQNALSQVSAPVKIRVNGVELTYVEEGQGEPLILLHGGQTDYRSWLPHMPAFAGKFRVIAYSRRYNYPNDNPISSNKHSAYVEAADLAALIEKLRLGKVHLVGTSMGAYTALIVAVQRRELVRTLALAEPNLHAWVKDTPEFKDFLARGWFPAAEAFKARNDREGMRIMVNIFGGPGKFESLPPEAVEVAMQNARFFRAATMSVDHSPDISQEKVRGLKMPVLIIRGENTFPMARLMTEALERVLKNAERVIIPKAGHGSPRENPQAFSKAVLDFLARSNGSSK